MRRYFPPAIIRPPGGLLGAGLIGKPRLFGIERIDAALAFRLAGDLAGLLDQLTIEKKTPDDLEDLREKGELSEHWQRNAELVDMVRRLYPEELARLGLIDLTDRRNRLLEATARRWACRRETLCWRASTFRCPKTSGRPCAARKTSPAKSLTRNTTSPFC